MKNTRVSILSLLQDGNEGTSPDQPLLFRVGERITVLFVFNPGRSSGALYSVPPTDHSGTWPTAKGGPVAEDSLE